MRFVGGIDHIYIDTKVELTGTHCYFGRVWSDLGDEEKDRSV